MSDTIFKITKALVEVDGDTLAVIGMIYLTVLVNVFMLQATKKSNIQILIKTGIIILADISLLYLMISYMKANNGRSAFIISLMLTIIAYLIYRVVVVFREKADNVSFKILEVLMLVVFDVMEIILINNWEKNDYMGWSTLFIAIISLLVNIMIVCGINKVKTADQYKRKMELMENQNRLQTEHYDEISKKYEQSGKIIHDMKKHLEVLTHLKGENKEKADIYNGLINEQMNLLVSNFKCSNEILEIIMSQKLVVAQSEDINVKIDMVDNVLEGIIDTDITAIFSNLWDNAIEASRKVDREKRFINIMIGEKTTCEFRCLGTWSEGLF